MDDQHAPATVECAGGSYPRRPRDPGEPAFSLGLLFVCSIILTAMAGLHGEVNPLGVLIWAGLGIVTSCHVAAAWEQPTWLGARTRRGRAAVVLTAFGWMFGCFFIFGPRSDPHASDTRRQVRCASNLRQIGQAMLMYANDHASRYPDRPDELLAMDMESQIFVCPSTSDTPATGPTTRDISDAFASGGHLSYIYLGKGLTSYKAGAEHVLAYEPLQNHTRDHPGINVLFGDGRVEFVDGAAAQRLTERLGRGENPPTPWRQ